VRLDPATVRSPAKGFADEVDHGHKEIVPTSSVTAGNYPPSAVTTKMDDSGSASTDKRAQHIPIGP
jgi:hypothetical protein